jgi:hypothetical protein
MMTLGYLGHDYFDDISMIYNRPVPVPNLKTGVGHGHPRGNRERPEKGHHKKKHLKKKMAKQSRRRNRT